jgi:hypothetical protein
MAAQFEVLILPTAKRRALRAMTAFCRTFRNHDRTRQYYGNAEWLVVFGWGGTHNQEAMTLHREKGLPVLVLDIGYFGREQQSVRFSVNELHPNNQLHYAPDGSRFRGEMTDDYSDDGHAVVLQLTGKSRRAFGYTGGKWEADTVDRLRGSGRYSRIVMRPKRGKAESFSGAVPSDGGTIGDDLRGSAGIFVHHSNCVIDAALHGIPCYAEHGVGANTYTDPLGTKLDYHERKKFLERVSWFSWGLDELTPMMQFAEAVRSRL